MRNDYEFAEDIEDIIDEEEHINLRETNETK